MTPDSRFLVVQKDLLPLIKNYAYAHPIYGMEPEDEIAELLFVLWKSCQKFNEARTDGNIKAFYGFFWRSARNHIASLARRTQTKSRRGITQSLSDEAVEAAVNQWVSEPPAEMMALANISVLATIKRPTKIRKVS